MHLNLDINLALWYKSPTQRVRIITEKWVEREVYCPNCENALKPFKANNPVGDFYCGKCKENFELKSKKYSFSSKIIDGAYLKMREKLLFDKLPNFFFLNYDDNNMVVNFFVVPKHFFSLSMIEERKPLSNKAIRSGWIGCNILLDKIPNSGKIYYVKYYEIICKEIIKNHWTKTLFLKESKTELRGWTLDVMSCIDKINKTKFSLEDIYKYEDYLRQSHPNNKYIKEKIRQQLQYLRDKGYLRFLGAGKYEKIT